MSCILYNTSTIDNLQKEKNPKMESGKGEKAAQRTAWQNVQEVFGGPLSIHWLLPTDINIPLVFEREYDWLITSKWVGKYLSLTNLSIGLTTKIKFKLVKQMNLLVKSNSKT